jgi:hypothetical protein
MMTVALDQRIKKPRQQIVVFENKKLFFNDVGFIIFL